MVLYDLLLAPGPLSHRSRVVQLLRVVAAAAVGAVYLATRTAVTGGDQLVSIYRKVENPVAFLPGRGARVLATGYLHAR
jgi:hypothetical protein